jgi:hypothetical protein
MYGTDVLVHSCFAQESGEPQPAKCSCKKLVAYEEAKRLVKVGEADWLMVYKKAAKHAFPTSRAVVLSYQKQTPRVQTIERTHIERIIEWDGDKSKLEKMTPAKQAMMQERLERMDAWQGVALDFWSALFHGVALKNGKVVGGAPLFIPDPFEGRAILIMWDDERTSHGRNANIDKSWDDIIVLEQNEGLETALRAQGGYRIRKESA